MKALLKSIRSDHRNPHIEEVRDTFDLWRAARQKKGPLPEELWSSAVALCDRHSLSEVSQALRLNYSDLRKRVNGRNGSGKTGIPEISFFDVTNSYKAESSGNASECSMEIRDGDGFSLKMQCRGEAGVDIEAICRLILDRR